MAQIDSSIALGVRPPQFENRLAQMAQMEQLGAMREASQLRGLQADALRTEQSDNALMRQILGETGGDLEKASTMALTRGLVKPGLDLQKRVAEGKAATLTGRKLEGDIAAQGTAAEKARLEGAMQQFAVIGQIMGPVRDQASYDAARQQAAQVLGPEAAAKIPPQYDPAAIERNRQQAMTMQQQIEARYKALGFDLQERQFSETGRHNRQTEATASAAANKPSPGQFLMAPDGTTYLGDPRSGQVRPTSFGGAPGGVPSGAAPATGGPMMPGPTGVLQPPAMPPGGAAVAGTAPGAPPAPGAPFRQAAPRNDASEDERKAAGWYQQANKAIADMQAARREDPGAAKPSVMEAVPGIPNAVTNMALSPARQKFNQGASALSEATLRAATGAGVNIQEATQKIRELTPQWGDSDGVIAQKFASQQMYLESLKARAGRALPGGQAAGAPAATGASDNDPLGLRGGR